MSGIVGIINLEGEPVDRQLLQDMTSCMIHRGPDALGIWADGNVGFGHTMFRTTAESLHEQQPYSLDGQVWITADVRLDGRSELIAELESHGCPDPAGESDAGLILHAYRVWGESCVKQLLGDFAFAIWDAARQRLFCARDHFGVKPFYYARIENCLLFSNTLNCVKAHPAVSDRLNDLAIADFLLFGFNQDLTTTSFADIQRLPPAHTLTRSDHATGLTRYWTLSTDGNIRYKRSADYIDHFKECLQTAIADRLRTERVGLFMSGGLDSTAVASMAYDLLSQRSGAFDLRAYTVGYDRLMPDDERYYAGLVAKALGIPCHYQAADQYTLYDRWEQFEYHTPEPVDAPLAAIHVDHFQQVAAHSRVTLGGLGGDPALYPSSTYLHNLLKNLRIGQLLAEVGKYIWSHKRLPYLGLRSGLKRRLGIGRPPWQPVYPAWLNSAYATDYQLADRWRQLNRQPAAIHPRRAEAYNSLLSPGWPCTFEIYDPGSTTLSPIEVRQPFFDLRLVNYLLAIPPMPWFENKTLLRLSMRGLLPEPVRLRPKAALARDPFHVHLRQSGLQWEHHFDTAPQLEKYVDKTTFLQVARTYAKGCISEYDSYVVTRPLSLAHWLTFTSG